MSHQPKCAEVPVLVKALKSAKRCKSTQSYFGILTLNSFVLSGSKYIPDGGAENIEAWRLWLRRQDQSSHHHAWRATGDASLA